MPPTKQRPKSLQAMKEAYEMEKRKRQLNRFGKMPGDTTISSHKIPRSQFRERTPREEFLYQRKNRYGSGGKPRISD